MQELVFDASKVKLVPISQIQANAWNPKDPEKDIEDYQKIVASVKTNGLRGYINVRTIGANKYEITDGEQRWRAANELHFPQMYVYDDGEMTDQKAKELTIWYQQQKPFDKVKEAYLVNEMVNEFGMENLQLPYTEAQYQEFSGLANFSFEDYKDEEFKDNSDGTVTFTVKLSKTDHEIVKGTLEGIVSDSPHKIDVAEALVQLCTDHAVEQSE